MTVHNVERRLKTALLHLNEINITPKNLQRHFEKFKELGAVTQVCLNNNEGQTTKDFYKCIGREAHKQI